MTQEELLIQQGIAESNTLLAFIVLALVFTGAILYFRFRPAKKVLAITPIPIPPGAVTPPQAVPATPVPTGKWQKLKTRFWFVQTGWFWGMLIFALLIALILYSLGLLTVDKLTFSELSFAIRAAVFLIFLGIIMLILFISIWWARFFIALGLVTLLLLFFLPESINWIRSTAVELSENEGKPTIVDTCPSETMRVLQPNKPHTEVRDPHCSSRLRMLWQSTDGAPTIETVVTGSSGERWYNWKPGRSPKFTYDGDISEVTMTNLGKKPTTVWFVYKN